MIQDYDENPIKNIFKLYPWEYMLGEDFGKYILDDVNRAFWIEPAWKMILSNKAILVVLWEMFHGHPLLLPAYFTSNDMTSYVKKPLLSREGANISIVSDGNTVVETEGIYRDSGFVYQELFELPNFDGRHPVIGSWVIGQEPAGMGIREADTLITDNGSRFIPHLIED